MPGASWVIGGGPGLAGGRAGSSGVEVALRTVQALLRDAVAQWVTTTLPLARPSSTYAMASRVSSKGKVRSSTGRSVPTS
jgi:hypothetical protein